LQNSSLGWLPLVADLARWPAGEMFPIIGAMAESSKKRGDFLMPPDSPGGFSVAVYGWYRVGNHYRKLGALHQRHC